MDYTYKPLSNAEAEIRVAVIQPGAWDDDIYVSFRVRWLRRGRSAVRDGDIEYEALSYVWGVPGFINQVHILDQDSGSNVGYISMSKNLDVALRHLRHTQEERYMWIDAICINQLDNEEKSKQVALMGVIYSLASSVTAWLGPEEEGDTGALQLLENIASHIDVDWYSYTMNPISMDSEQHWADVEIPIPFCNGELDLVCSLFQRPYFDRTWIRQEIVLASVACVQCGHQKIMWQDFRKAMFVLYIKPFIPGSLKNSVYQYYQTRKEFMLGLCQLRAGSDSLTTLSYYILGTQCKDPRDRLYAMRSLLHPSDRAIITPDYTRPVEEVYTTTARNFCTKLNSLDLLETCELSSRVLELPSWVPDWSVSLQKLPLLESLWSACAWISPDVEFLSAHELRVPGITAARIEAVKDLVIIDPNIDISGCNILRELRAFFEWDQSPIQHRDAWLERCCDDLLGPFSESSQPSRSDYDAPRAARKRYLEVAWSAELTLGDSIASLPRDLERCNSNLVRMSVGRSAFKASNEYIGFGPLGTREGDIVCVLLGCRLPVVLRPCLGRQDDGTWQVVGVCRVPGMMNGELIYGRNLSESYQGVSLLDSCDSTIDGFPYGLHDPKYGSLWTDPADILEKVGIKVKHYRSEPHQLKVSVEELRGAGIPMTDFVLR